MKNTCIVVADDVEDGLVEYSRITKTEVWEHSSDHLLLTDTFGNSIVLRKKDIIKIVPGWDYTVKNQ